MYYGNTHTRTHPPELSSYDDNKQPKRKKKTKTQWIALTENLNTNV